MSLLAKLSEPLPERYYLGLDVGYKEHVAVVIDLQTFAQKGEGWKTAECLPFPSTSGGLEKLQAYLDSFSIDREVFLGICEPTGGYYGAVVYQYLLDQGYAMWLIENATTRHMREKIFGHIPKTDEIDARVMARICYLHEAVGEEFTLQPLALAAPEDAELLGLCRDSWKLKTMIGRARNQFSQLMALIFPELKTFFTGSVASLAPVSLMATYATPAEIAAAATEEVKAVLWKTKAYRHARRAKELQALARNSAGLLPDPGRAWRVAWLTEYLLSNLEAQAALDKQIERLVASGGRINGLPTCPMRGQQR